MGRLGYFVGMENQTQKLFSMRTDSDEGREFLAALDQLRATERPAMDRTTMIKKLVFDAQKRVQARKQ